MFGRYYNFKLFVGKRNMSPFWQPLIVYAVIMIMQVFVKIRKPIIAYQMIWTNPAITKKYLQTKSLESILPEREYHISLSIV